MTDLLEYTGESLFARTDTDEKWGDLPEHEQTHWNDIAKRCNFGRSLEELTQDEFEERRAAAKTELAAHIGAVERSIRAFNDLRTTAAEQQARAEAAQEAHLKKHSRIFAIADDARNIWYSFELETERRAKPQPGWAAK